MTTESFASDEIFGEALDTSLEANFEASLNGEFDGFEAAFDELDEPQLGGLFEGFNAEDDLSAMQEGWLAEDFSGAESDGDFALMEEAADYQVIGRDTRKRITNTTAVPFRYICKLSIGCTGTLVAPNKVLTAGHCVYNRKTGRTYRNMSVIPAKNGPGTSSRAQPFGSARAVRLDFPRAYATAKTYTAAWLHDYAIITLDRPLGRKVGWWRRIRALPAAQLRRVRLNTAGYPGDKGGQHLYWTYNRVVSVNGSRIEYLHDTFGGQSGSPVWVRWGNNRAIVAIHVARDDAGTPGATPIVANRGVAITPPILNTIQGWIRR